jgi:hypothetical protein
LPKKPILGKVAVRGKRRRAIVSFTHHSYRIANMDGIF